MSLRVFHPPGATAASGAELVLDREESHYLVRVRRAKVGEDVEVLDGVGLRWTATVTEASDRAARLTLGETIESPASGLPIDLLVAVVDPKAALEAIANATVLGARNVVFIRCERSPAAMPGTERIERLVKATLRQCGRPAPPEIRAPISLAAALAHEPDVPGFVGRPGVPRATLAVEGATRLLIGPEGGLSTSEERAVDEAGFRPLNLGPWTLRTETAVIAGLATLRGASPTGTC